MFKNLLLALLLFPALAFAQITPSPNNVNGGLNAAPSNLTAPVKLGTPKIADTGVLLQATSDPGNTYNQFIIQNTDAGNTASANYVVNNNLGTATTYYGEFGMDSSTFAGSGSLNLANAVYLDSKNGDLALGTLTSNAIHFVVNNGATDAMTIGTTGLVGIGTSSPTALLEINNAGGSSGILKVTDNSNSTALDPNYGLILNRNFAYINNAKTSGSIMFRTSASSLFDTTAMTILSGGNVGIGTTSPSSLLHMHSGTTSDALTLSVINISSAYVADTITNTNGTLTFNNGGGNSYTFQAGGTSFVNFGNGNQSVTIGASYAGTAAPANGLIVQGNVGIGTTAPLTGGILSLSGHPAYWQAAVPVVSACGGGTAAAGSTDNKGQITGITAATACTLTFGSAMPTAPSCHPTGSVAIVSPSISAISTSAVTFAMSAFTGTLYYICQ